ncbi:MAG: rhomboid family intramembrane serine protease [Acidobacteria bacterium]|nr:rhomboid family intramembrane serine protease [Acidobacteriota bacterium]
MIPIRDDIPSRSYPFVNVTLIAINVLMFLFQFSLDPEHLELFVNDFAVVPARYFASSLSGVGGMNVPPDPMGLALPIFTAMFLHGGWMHLGGNMLYLWIFGDNIEDRMGHARYLVFYLLCGVLATAAHIFTNADSRVPSLGASGAIAGVLGGYLLLYPHARVVTLIPIFIFLQFVRIPAVILLGFWFLQQFFAGAASLGVHSAQTGGVAWWAHIGGFVAGMMLVHLFKRSDDQTYAREIWWDRHR